jgi:hypothetical protein
MNLTEINKKLYDINGLPIHESDDYNDHEGYYEIKKLSDELYIKLDYYRDSYGYRQLTGIQFVQPTEVKITKFESI